MEPFHPDLPDTMKKLCRKFLQFDVHHRSAVALGAAGVTFGLMPQGQPWPVRLLVSWNAFALCSVGLAWAGMIFTDIQTRMREAHLQDSSRTALCGCVILSAAAGLLGGGMLLGTATGLSSKGMNWNIALVSLTIVNSWVLVHTVLALHYAHISYHIAKECPGEPKDIGVIFPKEDHPDFLDYAYISFVIGMTCQVSDVQITSRRIRRLALLHGVFSFGFNAVILAMSINLMSGMLSKS